MKSHLIPILLLSALLPCACSAKTEPSAPVKTPESESQDVSKTNDSDTTNEKPVETKSGDQDDQKKSDQQPQQSQQPADQTPIITGSKVVYPVTRSVQKKSWYCGPAAIQMLLNHYGLKADQDTLAKELNTSSVTGTEYEDMARVTSNYVFGKPPASNDDPGFRAWVGKSGQFTSDMQSDFIHHLKEDMETKDVLIAAIDLLTLYPDLEFDKGFVHVVLINGIMMDDTGQIQEIRIEDPSYRIEYQDEADHWFEMTHFLEAMNQCAEPGYIW